MCPVRQPAFHRPVDSVYFYAHHTARPLEVQRQAPASPSFSIGVFLPVAELRLGTQLRLQYDMASPHNSATPQRETSAAANGSGTDEKPRLTEQEKKQNHIASGEPQHPSKFVEAAQ